MPILRRALHIDPAHDTGTIQDVQHVVILMQENRSFDHYFGRFPGVRGYADPYPAPTAHGTVLQQSDGAQTIGPYPLQAQYPSNKRLGYITPHTWDDAQRAWNNGAMDQWLPAKTRLGLGYYQPYEIPFQTALADAFTLCDAYHCSMQAGTNPNRLFLWTGTNDPHGLAGGPALVNTHDHLGPPQQGYSWTTYPERLEAAGIDWAIYQDMADNYNDNPLAGFKQYRRAHATGDSRFALLSRALSTRTLNDLAHDIERDTLPQVCWLIAPAAESEHPEVSCPVDGAAYTLKVLDILTRNPKVWSRTVLFVTYDENDCFFDHMPPPAPPARHDDGTAGGLSTVDLAGEYHDARIGPSAGTPDDPADLRRRAFGLGPRVPMFVVSPWSRGGWVNSQVFDHTSVIRFLEQRFGVMEPNISAWRRAVCGDLTSTLDFSSATGHSQTRMLRPARALPYELEINGAALPDGQYQLIFHNTGQAAAVFQVYDMQQLEQAPRRYTVEAGKTLADNWRSDAPRQAYDLWVLGPNGFHRRFQGLGTGPAMLEAAMQYSAGAAQLVLHNSSQAPCRVTLHIELPQAACLELEVPPLGQACWPYPAESADGWYDVQIRLPDRPEYLRHWVGKIETGRVSNSDPRLHDPGCAPDSAAAA